VPIVDWLLSDDATVYDHMGKDGSLERFTVEDGLAGHTVNALLVAPDGTLWVATDGGVSRRTP
jgi:ligand-binding sensor domain-containing protein